MASWVLAFNEQARAALARLDALLQEEVLDELDALAANPGQLRRGGVSPVCSPPILPIVLQCEVDDSRSSTISPSTRR